MMRKVFFLYGVIGHLLFLAVYAWMAVFFGDFVVGKTIDSPAGGSVGLAVAVDLGLILLFGLQHSIMARPSFKKVWTKIVPQPIERATYVWVSCIVTAVLLWQWRPIGWVVWDAQLPAARWLLHGLFIVGWVMVPVVSLLINHFDLFGTRQVWLHLRGREYTSLPFRTPGLYKQMRHPLYVGWMIAFWAAPTMTAGHLVMAAGMSIYILIAIGFEERNLIEHFGRHYVDYRKRVPMFWSVRRSSRPVRVESHEEAGQVS